MSYSGLDAITSRRKVMKFRLHKSQDISWPSTWLSPSQERLHPILLVPLRSRGLCQWYNHHSSGYYTSSCLLFNTRLFVGRILSPSSGEIYSVVLSLQSRSAGLNLVGTTWRRRKSSLINFVLKDTTMDNVKNCDSYVNIPLTHWARSGDVMCFLWGTNIIHRVF
jgi:hypothetical protein